MTSGITDNKILKSCYSHWQRLVSHLFIYCVIWLTRGLWRMPIQLNKLLAKAQILNCTPMAGTLSNFLHPCISWLYIETYWNRYKFWWSSIWVVLFSTCTTFKAHMKINPYICALHVVAFGVITYRYQFKNSPRLFPIIQ